MQIVTEFCPTSITRKNQPYKSDILDKGNQTMTEEK